MMIEIIRDNLYRIEIPLPQNPLKILNAYFIRGSNRNLLIDTGFNREECREAMDQAIRELDISMKNTDIIITHVHADHSGLTGYLARPETKVYTGSYTAREFNNANDFITYYKNLVKQGGLMEMGFTQEPSVHPGYLYRSSIVNNVTIIREGTFIRVGDYNLQCIMTTGHAPDHVCLYDKKNKILFSGDHILGKITPNNTIWDTPWEIKVDYLDEYLKNLEKIQAMDIELVLPGHRKILTNCYQRIEELKMHHHNRLNHILEIMGNKTMTAAEVASKMKWDLKIKYWSEFPPAQKLFATGEALSHLSHLVCKEIVTKAWHNGVVYYKKV
ncbi:MAG: MBL fold metallo-hydrolase [Syntrophomonadaceae bacterium]|jgi:glyoxylase-like metal-dependent hydrolase (beta-lactamase superfamily II)